MYFFSRHACALIKNPLQRYYFFLIHANNSEDFCDFTPKIFVILLRLFLFCECKGTQNLRCMQEKKE